MVLAIVAMLGVAYWALVGFKNPVEDFRNSKDTPQDDLDFEPTAYAVFKGKVGYAIMDYDCDAVLVKSFTSAVYDYTSFDEGRVYETDKFNPLAVEEVVGYLVFKVTVTKSSFTSTWTSDKVALTGYYGRANADYTFETGRCFVPDKGTYSALLTVSFVSVDGGSVSVEAQKTITFEVIV